MGPTVFLFSSPGIFPLYLVENLLSNLCRVVVFSGDLNVWKKNTSHITKTNNLIIDSKKYFKKYPKPDYFMLVGTYESNQMSLIREANFFSVELNSKGFVIIPQKYVSDLSVQLPETIGIIYSDNLFGPRMELNKENRISQVISAAVGGNRLTILEEERISPVYMGDAAKLIVKWLFSFGPYGKAVLISSRSIGIFDICGIIKKVYPDFKYKIIKGSTQPSFTRQETYLLDKDMHEVLKETLKWIKNNNPTPKVSQKFKFKVKGVGALAALCFLLVSPFVFMFLSTLLLLISVKTVRTENFGSARFFINSSHFVSGVASKESKILSSVPLLGKLYGPSGNFSFILFSLSALGQKGLDLIENAYSLTNNILGDEEYNLQESQEKIASDLSYIETKLLFIEGELKNYPNLYKKVDFALIKKVFTNFNKISFSFTDLLGVNKTKTYLILFQNNMELRPTGGFIGSFALASFNSGKLNEISVQDVYSADGQLKGHVEPPLPIKKYLGEANWFLRDSNWNPDFSVSAKQAEWFLEKEIDIPVDGVIAIDLNVIKELLKVIGPIYLDDYQTQISSDNFYEKTQAEVERDFFPGSTKKANFMTALTKEITNALLNNRKSKAELAKIIFDNLEARHIQIFLHNTQAQEAINNLNWDGAFNYPICSSNCFSDFVGIVEANLGVNKANYYIQRQYNLSVGLERDLIKKNLFITYKNNANLAMGNSGIYKSYTRLVIPLNSDVVSVKVGDSVLQPDIETISGRKEIGFFFELSPKQTKNIVISWQGVSSLNFQTPGEYLLYVRKQAGTPSEPISISYNTNTGVDLKVEPGYNTLFAKDIYSKVTWKK